MAGLSPSVTDFWEAMASIHADDEAAAGAAGSSALLSKSMLELDLPEHIIKAIQERRQNQLLTRSDADSAWLAQQRKVPSSRAKSDVQDASSTLEVQMEPKVKFEAAALTMSDLKESVQHERESGVQNVKRRLSVVRDRRPSLKGPKPDLVVEDDSEPNEELEKHREARRLLERSEARQKRVMRRRVSSVFQREQDAFSKHIVRKTQSLEREQQHLERSAASRTQNKLVRLSRALEDLRDKKWKIMEKLVDLEVKQKIRSSNPGGVSYEEYTNALEDAEIMRRLSRKDVKDRIEAKAALCRKEADNPYYVVMDNALSTGSEKRLRKKVEEALNTEEQEREQIEQESVESAHARQTETLQSMVESIAQHRLDQFVSQVVAKKKDEHQSKAKAIESFLKRTGLTTEDVSKLLSLPAECIEEEKSSTHVIGDFVKGAEAGYDSIMLDFEKLDGQIDKQLAFLKRKQAEQEEEYSELMKKQQEGRKNTLRDIEELEQKLHSREEQLEELAIQNAELRNSLSKLDEVQDANASEIEKDLVELKRELVTTEAALDTARTQHSRIDSRYMFNFNQFKMRENDVAAARSNAESIEREGKSRADGYQKELDSLIRRQQDADQSVITSTEEISKLKKQLAALQTLDQSQRENLKRTKDIKQMECECSRVRAQRARETVSEAEGKKNQLQQKHVRGKDELVQESRQYKERLTRLRQQESRLLNELKVLKTGKSKLKAKKGETFSSARNELAAQQVRNENLELSQCSALSQLHMQIRRCVGQSQQLKLAIVNLESTKGNRIKEAGKKSLTALQAEYDELRKGLLTKLHIVELKKTLKALRVELDMKKMESK